MAGGDVLVVFVSTFFPHVYYNQVNQIQNGLITHTHVSGTKCFLEPESVYIHTAQDLFFRNASQGQTYICILGIKRRLFFSGTIFTLLGIRLRTNHTYCRFFERNIIFHQGQSAWNQNQGQSTWNQNSIFLFRDKLPEDCFFFFLHAEGVGKARSPCYKDGGVS